MAFKDLSDALREDINTVCEDVIDQLDGLNATNAEKRIAGQRVKARVDEYLEELSEQLGDEEPDD